MEKVSVCVRECVCVCVCVSVCVCVCVRETEIDTEKRKGETERERKKETERGESECMCVKASQTYKQTDMQIDRRVLAAINNSEGQRCSFSLWSLAASIAR